jgi:hypothetical protein
MDEDSRGRCNYQARDIGLGVSIGSSKKGSSGKNSSRRTKNTCDAVKQLMFKEFKEMARARRDELNRRSQPVEYSSQLYNIAKCNVALLDEQMQTCSSA